MPIKFKPGFNPHLILSKIGGSTTVGAKGSISFSGFEIFEHVPVLHSMLSIPDAAKHVDIGSLIWKALSVPGAIESQSAFVDAINKELTSQLAKKMEDFELLTSISLSTKLWPKQISVSGSTIRWYGAEFPKKFSSRNALIEKHSKSGHYLPPPATYTAIGVQLKAKSPDAAASKALKDIDLLRGVLCLLGNKTMQVTMWGSEYNPINVIRLGSCHTLHQLSGTPASEGVWYDPTYKATQVFDFKDPVLAFKTATRTLDRIGKCKYGQQLSDALVRYCRAFDEPDPATAFLKLWTALESLTTPNLAKYDNLIYRCAFLFQEHEYHREILQHLREYRNRNVHPGEDVSQSRINCFQLQGYFHAVFWFLIRNFDFFDSLQEALEFLSLPMDISVLRRRRRLLNKAIKFVTPVSSQ